MDNGTSGRTKTKAREMGEGRLSTVIAVKLANLIRREPVEGRAVSESGTADEKHRRMQGNPWMCKLNNSG